MAIKSMELDRTPLETVGQSEPLCVSTGRKALAKELLDGFASEISGMDLGGVLKTWRSGPYATLPSIQSASVTGTSERGDRAPLALDAQFEALRSYLLSIAGTTVEAPSPQKSPTSFWWRVAQHGEPDAHMAYRFERIQPVAVIVGAEGEILVSKHTGVNLPLPYLSDFYAAISDASFDKASVSGESSIGYTTSNENLGRIISGILDTPSLWPADTRYDFTMLGSVSAVRHQELRAAA